MFVDPETGKRLKVPTTMIAEYEEKKENLQPATMPTAPAATGFINSCLRCLTPTAWCAAPSAIMGAPWGSKKSVSERIDEAAHVDSSEEMKVVSQHQTGQAPTTPPMGTKVTSIKDVPSEVIKANKTDLTPGSVVQWATWSVPALLVHVPTFSKFKDLPQQQFELMCQNDPQLAAENTEIAGTLIAALDNQSVHVKNFKENLIQTDATAPKSGYKMLHAIMSSEECGRGVFRSARIDDFNTKHFFTDTYTVDDVVSAANKARREYALLPYSERAKPNAEVMMLLSKMPICIEEDVAGYIKKIKKREARDLPIKWSYDELATMLAIDINTKYVESKGNASAGTARAVSTPFKKPVCVNCGSEDAPCH